MLADGKDQASSWDKIVTITGEMPQEYVNKDDDDEDDH